MINKRRNNRKMKEKEAKKLRERQDGRTGA